MNLADGSLTGSLLGDIIVTVLLFIVPVFMLRYAFKNPAKERSSGLSHYYYYKFILSAISMFVLGIMLMIFLVCR